MRFNDYEQGELDSLWDELEDARARVKGLRLAQQQGTPQYQAALELFYNLQKSYHDFGQPNDQG